MWRRSETGDGTAGPGRIAMGDWFAQTEDSQLLSGIAETARGAVGSETGGWRSQTQFESRWVVRFPKKENDQRLNGITGKQCAVGNRNTFLPPWRQNALSPQMPGRRAFGGDGETATRLS